MPPSTRKMRAGGEGAVVAREVDHDALDVAGRAGATERDAADDRGAGLGVVAIAVTSGVSV